MSEQNYYENFFQYNLNDIKNKWKGIIRYLISLKQFPKQNIQLLSHIVKTKMKFSSKSFASFLRHPNDDSFFTAVTNSDEIKNIFSKLNKSKSNGPNSL